MNEEFSDYEVLVATSTDGGAITKKISWEVDKETDIVVWCDIAGLMDKGTFDYDGKSITIDGYDKPFTAYIMRKECAEYVISKNANGTFSVDVILDQLQKNVRILEQLEETDTRTLQCVDAVKPITDKDRRKGKVLSFDDAGNPVCEVEVDDVEKIKAYRDDALASKTSASQSAYSASESERSASTTLLNIQGLVDGFDTAVGKKQTEVIDAIDSKQTTVIGAIDSHFSEKLYEKEIEFDEYTDSTIGEIEDIKNQAQASADNAQASAKQSQALVDNALEIVDPEGFRQDTSANITDLQLFKANTGALHFNGSGNAQCPKLLRGQQFSFAVRIKANKNDVLIGKQVNILDTGVFYFYIHSSVQRLSVYATGNSLKSVTTEQNDRIFDGNWHSLFVTYDGTTLTLLDEFGVLLTADYSIQEQTIDTKIGTNFVGEMSNVCLFNFDMSSADAPYTIADYQQGKPIPPKALNGFTAQMESFIREAGTTASATYTNGVIEYTGSTTATSVITRVRTPFVAKAGDKIRVVNTSAVLGGSAKVFNLFFRDDSNNEGISASIGTTSKAVSLLNENDVIVELTRDITKLAFVCEPQSSGSIQDVSASCSIEVEKVGTLLALEDYTITNGTTKMVFDYSGNNNDATITGDVKGDNDNRVQKLIDFIKS